MPWKEKILIGLGLVSISGVLLGLYVVVYGDVKYIQKYFLAHLAFLPIHALVLGVLIEEVLAERERKTLRRKMNVFVGIFFRQMGVEILLRMSRQVANWDVLENAILVSPGWKAKDFRQARQAVKRFDFQMKNDNQTLANVFEFLAENEAAISQMTRNPYLFDFDSLYYTILSLFHLLEESHMRGDLQNMRPTVTKHLTEDVAKSLRHLLIIWLMYVEFLKKEHPVLFRFRMGIHNVIDPELIDA